MAHDQKWLTNLFHDHVHSLRRFLLARGADPQALDDLMQQAFLVVWHKRDRIQSGKEKSFLFGAALRECYALRRKGHQASTVGLDEAGIFEMPAHAQERPPEGLESLVGLLVRLPQRTRLIIEMLYLKDTPAKEIA